MLAGLILVFTIFSAMAIGILLGFAVLNLFFHAMSHRRDHEATVGRAAVIGV